jgi:hypothetical protein
VSSLASNLKNLKNFYSHAWPAAFVPHPSFPSCLTGIVVTRSGSKYFRRVTRCRDFIDDGQSVLPPTLPANLFEKIF